MFGVLPLFFRFFTFSLKYSDTISRMIRWAWMQVNYANETWVVECLFFSIFPFPFGWRLAGGMRRLMDHNLTYEDTVDSCSCCDLHYCAWPTDYWDHILGIDKPSGGSVIFVYVYAPSFKLKSNLDLTFICIFDYLFEIYGAFEYLDNFLKISNDAHPFEIRRMELVSNDYSWSCFVLLLGILLYNHENQFPEVEQDAFV